jgi:putative membrane protein
LLLCTALGWAAAGPLAARAQAHPGQPGTTRDATSGRTTTTPPPTAAPTPSSSNPAPATPPSSSPAPAPTASTPAPAPAAPGQAPVAGAAPADQNNAIFAALSARNAHAIELGQLAAQRGSSEQVKQLGARLVQEHQQLEQDLKTFVASRGMDLASLPKPESENAAHQQLVQKLQALSGPEFDREFVLGVREVQAHYVQDLKDMRDRTPGKDAAMKKWLDEQEDRAEARLTATRQAKQAVDAQRAAKK